MSRPSRIVGLIVVLFFAGLVGCERETPTSKSAAPTGPVVYPINDKSPHRIGTIMSRDQRQYLFAKKGEAGFLLFGPYVPLPEGSFKITFSLRADQDGTRDVAVLDVNAVDPSTKAMRVLSSLNIRGVDVASPDKFRDIAIQFSTKGLAQGTLYEFRVQSSGDSGLWVEQTTLQPGG